MTETKSADQLAQEVKAAFDTRHDQVKAIAEEALGKAAKGEELSTATKQLADEALTALNEAKARLARMKHYLTANRGIDSARIKPIDGGYRKGLSGEIWLAREGDSAPKATPTVKSKDVRLKGTAKIRSYNCGDTMGTD